MPRFTPVPSSASLAEGEREVLAFWKEADVFARLLLQSASLRRHREIEQPIGFPPRVTEPLGEGQRLLQMVRGPVVFASFATQDSDHEIGVGDIAAAVHRTEHLPTGAQQGKRVFAPPLLPAKT